MLAVSSWCAFVHGVQVANK